ncbi:polysaccharide deacetylase family protein [Bacillus sp. SD088]|uniref:polysaccharide deacetylase family protein n=1 Tax=Bacillus sp. SD088 TaxID=2782012 RepID=UPI001A96A9C6|nr:polysaccharide deacetylase family protein [Bacillus sp. SD088]MBO0994482.1 polysaccharide deacetylase family protein [Bacillus sp. SD088]
MKKLMILLLVAGGLAACGNQSSPSQSTDEVDKSLTEEKDEGKQQDEAGEEQQEETGEGNEAEEAEESSVQAEEEEQDPQYELSEVYSIVPIDDANPKVALLTIDDAPDEHALEMAKTLEKLNAPAVFFVNGHFITTPEKEKIVKEIYDMGFEIGNHTYSHPDLTTLSPDEQKEEILSVNDQVEEITGERPKFFRAPFGQNTDTSREIAKDEKMVLMNWTYGYDWNEEYMNKEGIADIMVNAPELGNGANLLMHDREWTNAALEDIVKGLRDKGYETVDPDLIKTPRNEE